MTQHISDEMLQLLKRVSDDWSEATGLVDIQTLKALEDLGMVEVYLSTDTAVPQRVLWRLAQRAGGLPRIEQQPDKPQHSVIFIPTDRRRF